MKNTILLILAFAVTLALSAQQNKSDFTTDETAVKSVVGQFLTAAGSYDLEAMPDLFSENANIGGASLRESEWVTYTMTFEEFLKSLKSESNPEKYTEPVSEYTIHISEGKLAFVKTDAQILKNGKAERNNFNYFTLIKIDGNWKILNGSYVSMPVDK